MLQKGLVSVSFRNLSPEEIISAAAAADLRCIEWGSDVHAPCRDAVKLQEIVQLQKRYGVSCCSYGTYFRLGVTPIAELPDYIAAAGLLGTDILRLWCGSKRSEDCTDAEREYLLDQCRQAAKIAQEAGVTLCLECHMGSYTETKEGALELMQAVNSPAFRMYWQPNQTRSMEENVQYAKVLRDWITHIHVFQWKGDRRFPLHTGIREWMTYLAEIPGDHMLLLEFMPDDDVASLPAEAAALSELTGG